MIEMSVRMPLFRAKYIAWLALESLCRQEGVTFEWELIIAEEQDDPEMFGKDRIMEYGDRLEKVGCVRIKYAPLKRWLPLAEKMVLLVKYCSKTSKFVMFQSADYYSSPFILRSQYKAFQDSKIDWFWCAPSTIFYDIETGISKHFKNPPAGSGRGVLLSIARRVRKNAKGRRSGCDGWFWGHCGRIVGRKLRCHVDEVNWKYAFNTHGFNNISFGPRERWLRGSHPEWRSVPFDWKKNIPPKVMQWLIRSKGYLSRHRKGLK